jgi:hypothetical protein
MALTDYTDPDQPKRKPVNPLRFLPGANLIPAEDQTAPGPRPASQDPFAHPAARAAEVAQQSIAAPAPPTAPKGATTGLAIETPATRATADIGAPMSKPAAPAITDVLTPGKTGNAAVASYVGNHGLVDRFNQQHAGSGINVSLDANKRPVFSGTGGGQAIAAEQASNPVDIMRSEAAIRASDASGPKVAGIGDSTRMSDTIAPSMPAGLSARQQAAFLNQHQQTQAQLRGQDLNYGATVAGQGITARGQDLEHQTALARQGLTMRGQDLASLEQQDRAQTNALTRDVTQLELGQKQQIADLTKKALGGDQQALTQLTSLNRANRGTEDKVLIAPTATTDAQGNVVKGYDVLDARTGQRISGGQQQSAGPTMDAFIEAAKKDPRNRGVSDDDLKAYYTKTYGAR